MEAAVFMYCNVEYMFQIKSNVSVNDLEYKLRRDSSITIISQTLMDSLLTILCCLTQKYLPTTTVNNEELGLGHFKGPSIMYVRTK